MRQDDSETRKSTMEGEHRVQFGLIRALQDAVAERLDSRTVDTLLRQLIDYSEAHFLSEELLMRLASYDEYEEHAENHRQLIDSLKTVQQQFQSTGRHDLVEQVAKSSMAFILRHIQTSDVRFANWQRA
jgi:hemerythrin